MKRKAKTAKENERERQKVAGFFDGRYRQKVVPDKKKKARRNWARKNKHFSREAD